MNKKVISLTHKQLCEALLIYFAETYGNAYKDLTLNDITLTSNTTTFPPEYTATVTIHDEEDDPTKTELYAIDYMIPGIRSVNTFYTKATSGLNALVIFDAAAAKCGAEPVRGSAYLRKDLIETPELNKLDCTIKSNNHHD